MDSIKVKRVTKKVLRNGFWLASDVFFLALKVVGTVALIAVTTAVIFGTFFIMYVRNDIATGLDINPADFTIARSSVIYYVDPETGWERELVVVQSPEFRRWVNFDEFPEHLINAVVAIEDHRFWSHSGVDWYRTAGAFLNMFLSMQDTFGGSTITQQLIKNLTHEDDVTVQRKLQEIFRALEFERQFSKEEILELYLNLVYFGHGCYGIGAAAHYYFNKEVSELTLPEAAAIIGITNNPSLFSPYANRERNKNRQELILFRMHQLGYISEQEMRQAIRAPLHFQRGIDDHAQQIIYTWFEEAVMRDVVRDLVTHLGFSEQVARRYLMSGGLRIISTLNPEMQAIVDYVYQNPENLPTVTGSAQGLQSSIIIADPYTGEIRALSGGVGRKERNLLLNRATQTRRPPGSAIKPISVYAPAMDMNLLVPESIYNDSPDIELLGTTWLPRNATRTYSGRVTVRTALRHSINTIAAVVLDQVTPHTSFHFMQDILGFELHYADQDYAPLAAGQLTWGATVREMASAYTMFPNAGIRVDLRTFTMIYDHDGNVLLDNSAPIEIPAISDVTAYWMTDMLVDAVVAGTGGAAIIGGDMPVSGKTGTSTDRQDRWFVGFTPYYLAAVWTGFDQPARMESQGNPAAHIFRMVMQPIHENLMPRDFGRPTDITLGRPILNPWEMEEVEYTVIAVDFHGNVLYERIEQSIIGAEIFEDAPHIEGMRVVGDSFGAILVTADPSRNVIRFLFEINVPEPDFTHPGDFPYDTPGQTPGDPSAPGSEHPEQPPDHPGSRPPEPPLGGGYP
ncbi:MAG: PBP1A family penicillin-binding protein [Oscillospiraceae bacterium]|nr:PBP1A family penicillin-binding protein [Oscillospiraceae bacterium]MCL2278016.1 PBP1A family penicillin-binding protein [Oscillospiraceae bacterium]